MTASVKVLHITRYDAGGGANISAVRLHLGLMAAGVDSHLLVSRRLAGIAESHLIASGPQAVLNRLQNAMTLRVASLQRDPDSFGCSLNAARNGILRSIARLSPDIVHLHWIGANVLRIEDLPMIRQPIVWTMHDMWPFCGAEHCDLSDGRRRSEGYTGTNRNPEAKGPDLNKWVWRRKWNNWNRKHIVLVGPSRWISSCASASRLFGEGRECSHMVIPNGVDLRSFAPMDKSMAKMKLGLDPQRKWILFGAASLQSPIKGVKYLAAAVNKLVASGASVGCVVFGRGDPGSMSGAPVVHLEEIAGEARLAEAFSAADLTIVPSLVDNLPNMVVESFACGTPVVCFDTCGLAEMVDHQKNGFKAAPTDSEGLAQGIQWCLHDQARHHELCRSARATALERYDIDASCRNYLAIYGRLPTGVVS